MVGVFSSCESEPVRPCWCYRAAGMDGGAGAARTGISTAAPRSPCDVAVTFSVPALSARMLVCLPLARVLRGSAT